MTSFAEEEGIDPGHFLPVGEGERVTNPNPRDLITNLVIDALQAAGGTYVHSLTAANQRASSFTDGIVQSTARVAATLYGTDLIESEQAIHRGIRDARPHLTDEDYGDPGKLGLHAAEIVEDLLEAH